MKQLKRQVLSSTIGILNQLVDWQPPFGIKLHAHIVRMMPEY
jgi:hypothetical protein